VPELTKKTEDTMTKTADSIKPGINEHWLQIYLLTLVFFQPFRLFLLTIKPTGHKSTRKRDGKKTDVPSYLNLDTLRPMGNTNPLYRTKQDTKVLKQAFLQMIPDKKANVIQRSLLKIFFLDPDCGPYAINTTNAWLKKFLGNDQEIFSKEMSDLLVKRAADGEEIYVPAPQSSSSSPPPPGGISSGGAEAKKEGDSAPLDPASLLAEFGPVSTKEYDALGLEIEQDMERQQSDQDEDYDF
jgi:hypothetical protein